MSLAEELQKLQDLRNNGTLSDEEFATAKQKILNQNPASPSNHSAGILDDSAFQGKTWAMLFHLSLLAGHLVPLAGFVVPIIIWQTKRQQFPELELHFKNAANWTITELILIGLGIILIPFFVGFLVIFPLSIAVIVFPIIAAIKASNGTIWKYPLSIEFLK